MKTFGEQLTEARNAQGLTQEQLASALMVTRQTISSWERNRTQPDMDALRTLSKVLNHDFMNAGPVQPTEVPVEADKASSEAAHGTRRRRVALLIALAALALVCVCAIVLPGALHRGEEAAGVTSEAATDDETFDKTYYLKEVPNDPDAVYFDFRNSQWTEQSGTQAYDRYAIHLFETNGVGCELLSVKGQALGKSGVVRTFYIGPSDLKANGLSTRVGPYGEYMLDGGWPAGEFVYAGFEIHVQDDNGNLETFYALIEF